MRALSGWGSFHVIVGSAAGALIGLQFVMTLIADRPSLRAAAWSAAQPVFTSPGVRTKTNSP